MTQQELASEELHGPYELPEGWKWIWLTDLTEKITDGTHKTPKYIEDGEVPFLSIKDIGKGFLDFSKCRHISQEEHKKLTKRCKPEKGDVLFCRIGTLGKAVLINTSEEFSIFVSLGLIKVDANKLNPEYLVKLLNSPIAYWQYEVIKARGVHAHKLNLTDMKKLLIPLPFKNGKPDLEKQQEIVHKIEKSFEKIDKVKELREKAYEKGDSVIKNVIEKYFEDIESTESEIHKLDDLAEYINGRAFKPSDWGKKGLPIIRIQNLTKSSKTINYYDGDYDNKHFIDTGDILLAWSATLDIFEWKEGPAILNQHIFKIIVNKNLVEKKFYMYLIKYVLKHLMDKIHGCGMKHITKPKLLNFEVKLPYKNNKPDFDKQKEIVDRIDNLYDKIDEIQHLQQSQIDKFNNLKENILYKAFKGELI
ncbi:MAG: restriction endonuclease subunit S [Candidatus Woesearchaeota archaeon]